MENKVLVKIASYLGVEAAAIARVEEWKYVFFVVVCKKSPTFVSKKVAQEVAQEAEDIFSFSEIAEKIREQINADERFGAKLWDKKAGETRVYVVRCDSKKIKDCGYIKVTERGICRAHLTLQAGTIEGLYEGLKTLKIKKTPKLTSLDPLSASVRTILEECWECGATYTSYGNVRAGNMMCRRCE